MDLVGAWLRQLLRAGTAAAIVPVALVAALLVIALGSGGLGGLGSLGQLVAGPAVPEIDAASPSVAENVRVAPAAPGGSDRARARVAASTGRASGGRAPASAPGRRAEPRSGTQIAPTPGSSGVTAPSAPSAPSAPVAPPLAAGTSSPPPPPPPPAAGTQRPPELGAVLGSTVNGVVGGVQTLIDELGQALGLKPRAR